MGIKYKSFDEKGAPLPEALLPEAPQQPFEFKPLTLALREEGKDFFVEAYGPYGSRLASPTQMPERSSDADGMGEALFPGHIGELYRDLLQKTRKAGLGLRLQLDFQGKAKEYAIWAWEQVRLDGEYLLANPYISITRTVSSSRPALPFGDTPKPYRLLFLMACPDKFPGDKNGGLRVPDIKDSLEEDLVSIRQALASFEKDKLIEITVLKDRAGTLDNLQLELQREEYQALIISTHGFYANRKNPKAPPGTPEDTPDGALLFDDGEGIAHTVFGNGLSSVLLNSSVRLVFLNTAHTAYGASPEGEGIAEVLVQAGIPAVVAFQDQIYTNWGPKFAEVFFTTLTQLNSLELALLAGRKTIAEAGTAGHWVAPKLFTRFMEGEKVFSGEFGGKISAFVNAQGEVEIRQQKENESEVDIFNQQLSSLTDLLKKVEGLEVRTKVNNQILAATNQLRKNADAAIAMLTDSTMEAVAAIKKQEAIAAQEEALREKKRQENDELRRRSQRKQMERAVVLILAAVMILVVGVLAYYLDERTEIKVLGLPLPVVLWSFIGGVGATLYAFVGTQKYTQTEPLRLDWLIGRPIVGVIMGSVVYLAVATSLSAVGGVQADAAEAAERPYLLWALAFIGGFSDKFAILLFDNLVGKFTTGGKEEPAEKQKQLEE